jgi:hypothetical protein
MNNIGIIRFFLELNVLYLMIKYEKTMKKIRINSKFHKKIRKREKTILIKKSIMKDFFLRYLMRM